MRSAPDPAGRAYDAPPDPLVVSGFAPKALASRPLRRLKADPSSFLGTNLTLQPCIIRIHTQPTSVIQVLYDVCIGYLLAYLQSQIAIIHD